MSVPVEIERGVIAMIELSFENFQNHKVFVKCTAQGVAQGLLFTLDAK